MNSHRESGKTNEREINRFPRIKVVHRCICYVEINIEQNDSTWSESYGKYEPIALLRESVGFANFSLFVNNKGEPLRESVKGMKRQEEHNSWNRRSDE